VEISPASHGSRLPAEPTSIEELAAQQGVLPVTDFDSLLGRHFPDDETEQEFEVMLREWRSEGSTQKPSR